MYPTDEEIEECLDEVDEEELVAFLDSSEELSFLSRAIVRRAICNTSLQNIQVFLNDCINLVEDKEWELANKIAREKKERASFSCEMKDEFN